MAGVFLSYRRADSGGHAGRLFDHLSMRFGDPLVFLDVEDLDPGVDWAATLDDQVAKCDAFLAVIGRRWLDLQDEQGRRRIDLDEDVLRMEIHQALAHARALIPVLVDGAAMPAAAVLPESISELAARQAVSVRDDHWRNDVEELLDWVRKLLMESGTELTLEHARTELSRLQAEYFTQLDADAPARALELADEALGLLDSVFPHHPHDAWMKLTRGYLYKNQSMALRELGRREDAEAALDKADRVFRTMHVEDPDDPSALNGRGSVAAIRGLFAEALEFIDQALAIAPTYEAALRDREMVAARLSEREEPAMPSIGVDTKTLKAGRKRLRSQVAEAERIERGCALQIEYTAKNSKEWDANYAALSGQWREWTLFTERLIKRLLPGTSLADQFMDGFEGAYAAAEQAKSLSAIITDLNERCAVLEQADFEIELLVS